MKRILLLLTVGTILVLTAKGHHRHHHTHHRIASYQDRDMDGVIDRYDLCPHTPFFALVNKKGCMIKKLKIGALSNKR